MRPTNVLSGMHKIGRLLAGCLLIAAAVVSCSGDTDGGSAGDESYLGTSFVGSDGKTGTIELEVLETSLNVSESSGFRVYVKDSAGRPVPQIRIYCDTEVGLALIEPNTGSELTDNNGQMSGKVGCEVPGSLQMACRLPIGVNWRKFETIHCGGAVPAGFSGFGNTAGGGLGGPGGGVATDDNGGVGGTDSENGVRITSIATIDNGEDTGMAVDVEQDECGEDCGGSGSCTDEPFYDTLAQLTVENNTNQSVQFTSMRYRVPNATGVPSATFTSDAIAIGDGVVEPGESKAITVLFLNVSSGGKTFVGSSNLIGSSITDFRNVTFYLTGANDLGEDIEISGSAAISFDNYCSCSSGACG